jgi:tetrathionate reductase subunit B
MTRYGIAINLAICTRCRACIIACKTEHQISTGKHSGHEYHRIKVLEYEEGKFPKVKRIFAPIFCMQCDNAPCIDVCPIEGALFRRKDGAIVVEGDKCIGCKYCIQVCPYDAFYFNEEERIVDKCDFCAERLDQGIDPACVATCMNRAIVFGDLDNPESEISKMIKKSNAKPERPLWPAYYSNIFKPAVYYSDFFSSTFESDQQSNSAKKFNPMT